MTVQEIKHYRFGCSTSTRQHAIGTDADGMPQFETRPWQCPQVSPIVAGADEREAAFSLEPHGWFIPLKPSIVGLPMPNRIIDEIKCPNCMNGGAVSTLGDPSGAWGADIDPESVEEPRAPLWRRLLGRRAA